MYNLKVDAWLEIGAACYRTDKVSIPKSGGESAGKRRSAGPTAGNSAGRTGFVRKSRGTALFPAVPPAVPFLPALFPALSPALLGIWALSVL